MAFLGDAASVLPPAAGSAYAQGLKPPTHGVAAGGRVHWVSAEIPQEKKNNETFVTLENLCLVVEQIQRR